MKNIFKISILSFVLASLGSCTNDKDPVASPNAFELRKDAAVVSPAVLLEANNAVEYGKFTWDKSNFNVGSIPAYTIVVSDHDADPNLTNPAAAYDGSVGVNPNGDAREATLTVEQFNVILNQLPTFNCGQMNIDIRIKSKLGVSTNAQYQYSNPITVAVTGYAKKPLFMVLARDSDTPATSTNRILTSAYNVATDYQGFMYLEAGDYKLYQPDPCGGFSSPTVYGVSGGNTGTLVSGGSTYYNVPATGHYYVTANANTGTYTYTITPFNNTTASNVFGLFGNAKGTVGSGNTTPMTYDPATKNWTVTMELINGRKFGFKTGNGSSVAAILVGSSSNPGSLTVAPTTPAPDPTGSITAPGSFVDTSTKTRYNVVVNVSTPRQYTYTLTPNPL